MQQWFNNLKRQQQIMLLAGAAAILFYLMFVLVLAPMSASATTWQRKNQAASATLVEVKQLAREYQRLQNTDVSISHSSDENLTRIIDNSVKANQLTMSRFQPSSTGDVQIRFEDAVFNHVLAWLYQLEGENGILVKDLSVTPGVAAGLVNVSVRLRKNV